MRADYLRKQMIKRQLEQRGITDDNLLQAMGKVERHRFVPEAFQHLAYSDSPLSIGSGQTISQPYIVALMIQILKVSKNDIVLEIGTGSGYQTAIIAEMAKEVFTIERISSLGRQAKKILDQMHYKNIHFQIGDGTLGWQKAQSESVQFDRIIVAAAAPEIPLSLMNQIANGGKLIIPAGDKFRQELILIERKGDEFITSNHGGCTFVPLIGEEGWKI